jgi:serine/threonine protein kinase
MTPEQAMRVFRQLFLADLELGETRSEEEYLELFPGMEGEVREQLLRLQEPSSRVTGGGTSRESRDEVTRDGGADGASFAGRPGEMLGRYRIEKEIGRGGQAIVYLAQDDSLSRRVALKVLTRIGPGSEGLLERFRREAEMASRLDHKGICTIFEAQVEGGLPFIVMQLVEGETLAKSISQRRLSEEEDVDFETPEAETEAHFPVPDREEITRITETFEGIARALHAAHEAGITHRDIKPGNIMIQPDGNPIILDFGLARDDEGTEMSLTRTGDFFGTPGYMSPEQLSAHRIRLDERTDIFSLGVALFEVLASRRPFEAATREGVYQAILTKDPPDIRRFNADVPRDLKIVLETALEKDRDRRYQTAEEFAEELRRVREFEPIVARPASLGLRLRRWSQRNPGVAVMLVVMVAVLGIGWLVAAASTNAELERVEENRARKLLAAADARFDRLTDQVRELSTLMETDPYTAALRSHEVAQIAVGLGGFEERGFDFVEELYRSERQSDRVLSTQLLALFTGDEAFEALSARAMTEEPQVAKWAANGIIRREHPDLERVCREMATGGHDISVRINGAWGLCRLRQEDGVTELRKFLNDPNVDVSFRMLLASNVLILRNETVRPLANEIVERALDQDPLPQPLLELAVGYYKDTGGPESRLALERLATFEKLVDTKVGRMASEALESFEAASPD